MPMPTGGPWPPPEHTTSYQAYRDWDAWYAGDPDRLRDVYAGRGGTEQRLPPSQRRYPGQQAGGVLGRFSRWLWGAPQTAGVTDGRLHLPLPADLSAAAANLLFSEPPQLSHETPVVMKRLDQLIADGLAQTLIHAAEAASALGDVYLRPIIDQEVHPRAIIAPVHADGAIPVIRWGMLVEVTFWSVLAVNGATIVRLLEHHDVVNGAGRITYGVFEGDRDRLGRPVPYADYGATAHLAALVDADGAQATGLDRLDVVRIPNAGPQRLWRTVAPLRYHGRSDYDGAEPLFDQIDSVWTSWMLDVRNARGRVIAPDYMLQDLGRGQGAVFDPYREVFTGINAAPGQAAQPLSIVQFAIRHAEHKATADALVEAALRHAGLSNQTLGEAGGDVAMTATEAQARERQSFVTRGNRIQTWRPAIANLVELLLAVERAQLNSQVEPVKPSVEFGDSVSESPEATARTLQLLDAAGAVSTDTKVRLVHPDWDDQRVQAEVEAIQGPALQDPGTFTGQPEPAPEPVPVDPAAV